MRFCFATLSRRQTCLAGFLFLSLAGLASFANADPQVNQSARGVPLVDEVDVVVVGGSTGAVSAAIEAASSGADVYLVAPYPYLGDDMTATLRLWLEDGEVPTDPLAVQIFRDDQRLGEQIPPDRLPFTYEADKTPNARHPDTSPARLSDGACSNAANQSVQYDDNVTIVADLQKSTQLGQVSLLAFQRSSASDRAENFKVKDVFISTSDDGQTWNTWATAPPSSMQVANDGVVSFAVSGDVKARYVKLEVRKTDDVDRILLGEILILPPVEDSAEQPARILAPRPMHVKRTLDNALLAAGVKYIYSTYVTDVIRDEAAQPCGVVTVNRAGRQAILADVIIDATPRGDVARMTAAEFHQFPRGSHTLEYVVVGGEPQEVTRGSFAVKGAFQGVWPNPAETASGTFSLVNYSVPVNMPNASWDSWNRAEMILRDAAYHDDQQFTADTAFQVPPDPVHGQASSEANTFDAATLPLAVLQPKQVANLFLLGGCADIPREAAAQLLRPLNLIALGRRVGQAAATLAVSRKDNPTAASITGPPPVPQPAVNADVAEVLIGMRPVQQLPTIPDQARALPVLGTYDVVVVGGGTTGAPAGIAPRAQAPRHWSSSTCTHWEVSARQEPYPVTTGATGSALQPASPGRGVGSSNRKCNSGGPNYSKLAARSGSGPWAAERWWRTLPSKASSSRRPRDAASCWPKPSSTQQAILILPTLPEQPACTPTKKNWPFKVRGCHRDNWALVAPIPTLRL